MADRGMNGRARCNGIHVRVEALRRLPHGHFEIRGLRRDPDLVAHLREGASRATTIEENAREIEQLYRSLMA